MSPSKLKKDGMHKMSNGTMMKNSEMKEEKKMTEEVKKMIKKRHPKMKY